MNDTTGGWRSTLASRMAGSNREIDRRYGKRKDQPDCPSYPPLGRDRLKSEVEVMSLASVRPIIAAVVIGGIYLFNVWTPFDFIDDGAIPRHVAFNGVADWLREAWNAVLAHYDNRGTFLPTTWTFWRLEASIFGPHPMLWRGAWVLWCMASTYLMLLLMLELRISFGGAITATAFAIWNGHRIEIWTNLASPEAVAMPFALFALLAAARANKNARPLWLDLAGLVSVLVALGCKNTFIALVPAQIFLRVVGDGESLLTAVRRRWMSGLLLFLPIIWPVIHLLHLRANWHPGQYVVTGPSVHGFLRILDGWRKGFLTPIVGPAIVFAIGAMIADGFLRRPKTNFYRQYGRALMAAGLLAAAGLIVYLPMGAAAGGPGRYTIPAIFGFDLLLGILITETMRLPESQRRRSAKISLGVCLIVAAAYNLALQDRFRARATVLNDLITEVQTNAPADAVIVWPGRYGDFPDMGEGIHARWHLQQRGRNDLQFIFLTDEQENSSTNDHSAPVFMVVGAQPVITKAADTWSSQTMRSTYWFGYREFLLRYRLRQPSASYTDSMITRHAFICVMPPTCGDGFERDDADRPWNERD